MGRKIIVDQEKNFLGKKVAVQKMSLWQLSPVWEGPVNSSLIFGWYEI